MDEIDKIKKINKSIVKDNGTVESFDKQLIELIGGRYDTRFPMVVSKNSKCLNYITKNASNPILINVSTVIKIKEKHDIGYAFVSDCEQMIKNSIFAFDSLKHDTSKIIVLDEVDDEDNPIIAVVRLDKKMGRDAIQINEITSKIPKECDIEAFVHGSMCVAYSGRCLISNYMIKRDANKGICGNVCRYKYHLVEETRPGEYYPVVEDDNGTYIMNAKDLSMIHYIPELV